MKTSAMLFLLLLLTSYGPKPKFKYFNLSLPTYIRVNNLQPDIDDSVSTFLKDTLIKIGAKLISSEQHSQLMKQYFEDAEANIRNLTATDWAKASEAFRKSMEKGTPSQSLTILYTSVADQKSALESCDSIGFRILQVPASLLDQRAPRKMWHIRELTTRSSDSVALFL